MSKKNQSKPYRLLVVAHPDDETLFFAGVLLQKRNYPWHIICVTDANADGLGASRAQQFKKACKKLGASKIEQWTEPDIYEKHLDIKRLQTLLRKLPKPCEVYTHGPIGEYGHPHHQDVSYAVHSVFAKQCNVLSPAYNCQADVVYRLTPAQYKLKAEIYSRIYKGETLRFSNFLPHRNVDEFAKIEFSEVSEIYSAKREARAPKLNKLKKYKWYGSFLAEKNENPDRRPF